MKTYSDLIHFAKFDLHFVNFLVELRQKFSPNKTQTGFISSKYLMIIGSTSQKIKNT